MSIRHVGDAFAVARTATQGEVNTTDRCESLHLQPAPAAILLDVLAGLVSRTEIIG